MSNRGAKKPRRVGKVVGDCVYLHRTAAHQWLPPDGIRTLVAIESTHAVQSDWDYVKFDKKTGAMTFAWCKDWDAADEPIILRQERLADGLNNQVIDYTGHPNPFIIHGKHLFVEPDYPGFDYDEARRRFESYQGAAWVDKTRMGRLWWWEEHKHLGGLN